MRLYSKHGGARYRRWMVPLAALLLILCVSIITLNRAGIRAKEESKQAAEAAIQKALATCYATEGFYPANFNYLEEHYGVRIDRKKYVVNYQVLGSNTKPYVKLVEVGYHE